MAISVTLTKIYTPAPPGSQGFGATPGEKLLKDYKQFRSNGMGVEAAINSALDKSPLLRRQDASSEKVLKWFREVHQVIELAREAGHDVNNINDARALLNPPKEKPKKKEPSGSELPPDTGYSYPHEDPNGNIVFVRGKVSDLPLTNDAIPELSGNSPAPVDSLSIDSPDPTLLVDKYKDLLCESDTVYFRGSKIQGPELEKHKEYSIIDCSSGWVKEIVAKYDSGVLGRSSMDHYYKGNFTTGLKDSGGLIFRPINRLEAINGTPIDGAAVSLTPQNKFNKDFVKDLDREKGKVYQVTNKQNGKYFYGTYTGHSETTNGNFVLWFKEGFCVEISKDTFELAPIGEDKGAVYPSSRRPERKTATRVAHGELTAMPRRRMTPDIALAQWGVTFNSDTDAEYSNGQLLRGSSPVKGKLYSVIDMDKNGEITHSMLKYIEQGTGCFKFEDKMVVAGRQKHLIFVCEDRTSKVQEINAASTSGEIKVGTVINLMSDDLLNRLEFLPKGSKFTFVGGDDECTFESVTEPTWERDLGRFNFTDSNGRSHNLPLRYAAVINITSLPESQIPKQTDKTVTLRVGESPEGKLTIGAFYKNTQGYNTFPGSKLLDWHKEDERGGSRTFYHLVFESDKPGFVSTVPITSELTLEEVPEPKKATGLSTSAITFTSTNDEASIKKLKVGTTYKVCDRQPEGHSETFERELKKIKRDGGVVFLDFGSAYHDVVVHPGLTLTPVGTASVLGVGDDLASKEIKSPPLREGEIFVKGSMIVGGNLELNAVYDIYKPYDVFDGDAKYPGTGRKRLFSAVKLLRIDNEEGSIVYRIENEVGQSFHDDDCPEGFIFKKLPGDDAPGARGITRSGHITALSLDNLPPQMDRSKSFMIGSGPDRIFTQKYYRFCMIVKGEIFLTAGKILNTNQAAGEGIIVELELPDGRRDMILCRLSDFIQPIEDPKLRIVLNEKESPEGKLIKDKWYKAYDRTEIDQTAGGARYDSFTKDGSGYYTLNFDSSEDGRYPFAIPIHHPNTSYSFEEVSPNPIVADY